MPRSDCADAQADLGFCCPHMPEDTFSHGAARSDMDRKINKVSCDKCECATFKHRIDF